MGKLAGRTIMHFSDGSTLTDKEIYPHDLDEEKFSQLTSVERVITGWHLSMLKSDIIKNFFIMTERFQRLQLGGHGVPPPRPPIISTRALGCYLKDSEPPVRILVGMDPRTKGVTLEAEWVDSFRADGFAKPLSKKKKRLKEIVMKPVGKDGIVWGIRKQPPVRRIFPTPKGLGCLVGINKTTRAIAEIKRVGNNCHVLIQEDKRNR